MGIVNLDKKDIHQIKLRIKEKNKIKKKSAKVHVSHKPKVQISPKVQILPKRKKMVCINSFFVLVLKLYRCYQIFKNKFSLLYLNIKHYMLRSRDC